MEFLGRFAKNVLSFPAMSKYGDADPLAQPLEYLEESRELHVRLSVLDTGDIGLLRAYLRRQLLLRQTGLTAFLLQPLRQDKCLRLPVKSVTRRCALPAILNVKNIIIIIREFEIKLNLSH